MLAGTAQDASKAATTRGPDVSDHIPTGWPNQPQHSPPAVPPLLPSGSWAPGPIGLVGGPAPTPSADNGLESLISDDRGTQTMMELLRNPEVQDIRCNRHDRIFFTDAGGPKMLDRIFPGPEQYVAFINQLLPLTDVGYQSLESTNTSVIEGSFRADRTNIKGSVFIATEEITRGEPALVIRKQPTDLITLDKMFEQGLMSLDMRMFLEYAVRGRLNMLISGGSGAGKTTLARALSWFVDPAERVLTCEEIDELHLDDRLPNVVAMTTFRELDEEGRTIREQHLEDLVRHALRMRGDRIWIGETRGKEAYALVKACLSGHDGSVTTVHANHAAQAINQLVSYVMESHLTEQVARDQVAGAFHLAVQIQKVELGRRVITEIVELEDVQEGNKQRRNDLWRYNPAHKQFERLGRPSPRLISALARHNVNYDEVEHHILRGA